MKDFLGRELKISDEIVCAVPHGRNSGASLVKGVVVGFTSKMITVICPNYNSNSDPKRRNISPEKVIKY